MRRKLLDALTAELSRPGFTAAYAGEDSFENAVWLRLWKWCDRRWPGKAAKILLTSHTERHNRSPEQWKLFQNSGRLADVHALGSKNRLDIVVRPPRGGTVGVEIKCLSEEGHSKKRSAGILVHGLGQAALALARRNGTILVIHCGPAAKEQRRELRALARNVFRDGPMRLVVAS